MSDNGWNWEDFFLYMWLMKLWDWTFGAGGRTRRSAKKTRREGRRNSRRYKGSREGLSAADNFICDLICFVYLAPLAALFVASRQNKYKKRAERQRQRSNRRIVSDSDGKHQGSSGARKQSLSRSASSRTENNKQAKATNQTAISEAQLHGMTEEQFAEKKRSAGRSYTISEDQKVADQEWAEEQDRRETARREEAAAAEQKKLEAEAEARASVLAEFTTPMTSEFTSDPMMLEMIERIAQASGDRGEFLGLFEISYLLNDSDVPTIPVSVKDENLIKNVPITSFPKELQQGLKKYLIASGSIQGYTKQSWINFEAHTMKAAIYFER